MAATSKTAAIGSSFVTILLLCCFCSRRSHGFAVAPALPFPQQSLATTTKMWFKNEVAAAARKTPTKPRKRPTIQKQPVVEIIRDLESPEELRSFLLSPGDDRPAVVFYYAGWCKNCQRVGLQLQKVARELGTKGGPVRFASVECKPSTQDFLLNDMCVTGLPCLRAYGRDGETLVDAGGSVRDLADGLAGILREAGSDREAQASVHEQLQLSLGVAAL